ncbi:MAG: galactokinase [Terriglobales bacterium]
MISSVSKPELTRDRLLTRFAELYGMGTGVQIFRAPGRVNLIGEHTDYNDGFVMPMAIGFYTWIAAKRRADRVIEVYSEHFSERISFTLDSLNGPPTNHWSDFIRGVAETLQQAGHHLAGASLLIHGEVPIGAGLSSSASLEVSVALALVSLADLDVPLLDLAKLCQTAEHKYVGTRVGIMDPFVASFGVAGHALMLDCRSLEYQLLAIPNDLRVIVCNSMVRHELASGEYNRRRADCEAGVKVLHSLLPHVHSLRDVRMVDLEKFSHALPPVVYRRCRHVVTENQRVLAAVNALKSQDADRFGHLLYRSHASLRDDYEVSCRELDLLVDLASSRPGVFGARMTGGGFGGCTVNLVHSAYADAFGSEIAHAYAQTIGVSPEIYLCEPAQGAGPWIASVSVNSGGSMSK